MNARYKLIFEGETLAGFKEKQVRKNLKKLLKADKEKLNLLFSGKPVILKKNLTADAIRPYEKAMIKVGAYCRIISIDGKEELPPTSHATVLEQERQDRATKLDSKFQLLPRMGRVQYVASLWMIGLLVVSVWLLAPIVSSYYPHLQSQYLPLVLIPGAILLLLMMSARRLHDIDRNGRASFFLLIPGLNLLFLLLLMLYSGTKTTNRYGNVPFPAGTIAQCFGLWIPLLVILSSVTYGWFHQDYLMDLALNIPDMIHQFDITHIEQYL